MEKRNNKSKRSVVTFFETYPRLFMLIIAIILCVVFFTIGYFFGRPDKTEAEIAYDEQVWATKTSKERVAQEELENKFIIDRANAEQTAQKIRLQIADIYAQTQDKITDADVRAILAKAKAESDANTEISETLSSDLMEYLRWKDNNGGDEHGEKESAETETQNVNNDSI